MARKGNKSNAVRYTAYKNSGRKLINKEKKQKRHEKLMAKFAARREAGKTYQYHKKGTGMFDQTWDTRTDGKPDNRLPLQKLDSFFRKLDNAMAKQKLAAKESERAARKVKTA